MLVQLLQTLVQCYDRHMPIGLTRQNSTVNKHLLSLEDKLLEECVHPGCKCRHMAYWIKNPASVLKDITSE